MTDTPRITVALAGNPNSGKTTLFNAITGARQHVGNYPGVTVEKKEGTRRHKGAVLTVVDLPGTYSLTAYSLEERLARNFIVDEKPDVLIDIVDASNLERNLYLAVQFIELGAPLVLAFNMSDMAKSRGYEFDLERLSMLLGAPIVPTVGHRSQGIEELLDTALAVARGETKFTRPTLRYGREIDEELARLEALLAEEQRGLSGPAANTRSCRAGGQTLLSDPGRQTAQDRQECLSSCDFHKGELSPFPARWVALKLLENDADVREKVTSQAALDEAEKAIRRLTDIFGDPPEIVIADRRYGIISGACQEAVRSTVEMRHTMSDKIDSVLTNRIIGLPIFLVLMWLVFKMTFTLGEPPMHWLESAFAWLGASIAALLGEGLLKSLIVDGVIAGVGGVLVFLPNILLLFFAIAVLEDSGYMARAAFIMDNMMHRIGLHGKSFIPMLIGFGCTVPAVMATRMLENRRDRLITILVSPLMSCGARFPVYVLLTGAFFGHNAVWVIFSIYLLGIVLAVVAAKVFGKWLLPGESEHLIMELPPYRMPTARGVLLHMWRRGWMYLRKAGTVILAFAVIIWALSTFPRQPDLADEYAAKIAAAKAEAAVRKDSALTLEMTTMAEQDPGGLVETAEAIDAECAATVAALMGELRRRQLEATFAGQIGHALAPALKPVGLGDWKIATSLFAGLGAKELVVGTMGTLYSLGDVDPNESKALEQALQKDHFYSPLVAYTLMVFVLVYLPCVAVLAIVRSETQSWRWPLFMVAYTTALAWLMAGAVYWTGRLLGLG